MDFMKVVVFFLFYVPAFILLAGMVSIAGILGAGSAMLASNVVDGVWVASALGGVLAAVGFYLFWNGLARVFSSTPKPPFKNYAAGGVAYFLGTFIGVPVGTWLAAALFTSPFWLLVTPCAVTGGLAFGLLWLAEKVKIFKFFPTRAQKPDQDKDSK